MVMINDKQKLLKDIEKGFGLAEIKSNSSKDIILHISEKLEGMDIESKSKIIDKFGILPLEIYLKDKELEDSFSFEEIEPLVKYLDGYLIEMSGGNKDKLNQLSNELTGSEINYPTQRMNRISILERYFSPYIKKVKP